MKSFDRVVEESHCVSPFDPEVWYLGLHDNRKCFVGLRHGKATLEEVIVGGDADPHSVEMEWGSGDDAGSFENEKDFQDAFMQLLVRHRSLHTAMLSMDDRFALIQAARRALEYFETRSMDRNSSVLEDEIAQELHAALENLEPGSE